MKRNIILIVFLAVAALIITQAFFQKGYSNRSGAPIMRTGSPVDGNTSCNTTSCHVGNPVNNASGWITSNIPGTGYISGTTYTITATATSGTLVRFGFEISPQTSTGAQAGTIVITSATTTRLAGAGNPKYITHTTIGTDAATTPGSKTWSFNWTAPLTVGMGTITFYGAFNCTNNSNSTSGDLIFLSQMIVTENLTNGWTESENKLYSFDVYPNPASGKVFLYVTAKQNLNYAARLIDVDGKCVKEFPTGEIFSGAEKKYELDVNDISAGVYFLQVKSNESVAAKKIIIL